MTLRQLVILIIIATGLLWIGWLWILFVIDPFYASIAGLSLFYGTLFLALTGTIALASLYIRRKREDQTIMFYTVMLSFRQAVIISSLFTVVLILQSQRLLRWWNILLLIVLAVVLEMLVLVRQRRRSPEVTFEVTEIDLYIPPEPEFSRRGVGDVYE